MGKGAGRIDPGKVGWGKGKIPCVPGDTLVSTPSGRQPIAQPRVGDRVWAIDPEFGTLVSELIEQCSVGFTRRWIHLQLGDGTVTMTPRHPVWVESFGEWRNALDLSPGMQLLTMAGDILTITDVRVEDLLSEQQTFNLHVSRCSNFFAGEQAILVHNGGPPLDKEGYWNYWLIDNKSEKTFYHGRAGPNQTPAAVLRRHPAPAGKQGVVRYNPETTDFKQSRKTTYGEARRIEHERIIKDGTIDPNEPRGNKNNGIREQRLKTYYPPDAC